MQVKSDPALRPIAEGETEHPGELFGRPETYCVILSVALLAIPVIPVAWLGVIPLALAYSVWFFRQKFRLPFRLPKEWKGTDYSNPLPGGHGDFRQGEGLLFLGNHFATNEEIWISNDDARRHALVLGTTGSGKALANDTLVLTETGWMEIGELQPGANVWTPDGSLVSVLGVFPQGKRPVVRLHFADGRMAECSRDHLWRIRKTFDPAIQSSDPSPDWETMTAANLGIQIEMTRSSPVGSKGIRFLIPLGQGATGLREKTTLIPELAIEWGRQDLINPVSDLDQQGSRSDRVAWLAEFLNARGVSHANAHREQGMEFRIFDNAEGYTLRSLVWSIGGMAMQVLRDDELFLHIQVPGLTLNNGGKVILTGSFQPLELEIVEVEGFLSREEAREQTRVIQSDIASGRISSVVGAAAIADLRILEKEMTCIKVDSDNGLFVMESYLVTHNTELLLGMVSQTLMWQSGFLFVDGKGTTEFHGRTWSLAVKFGREDDYRILNFTDLGSGQDSSAGDPEVQSNTLNPFSHGTPDQLMNMIVSLMGNNPGGEMWKHRAMALVTSAIRALCEMRDAGDVLLDVQSIRDYLPLGIGVNKGYLHGKKINDVKNIPPAAWRDMRSRGGMIELYLRALNDEFSETSKLALKGFFDSLPGFNLTNALNGQPQVGKAAEQHGFLSMQLTKPLGSLADDYGHIFRTPFGEVDMEDVVLNRRILVVLLPALQKAPIEMQNCGRIVIAVLKMMMGKVAGSRIIGTKQRLVDVRPTTSPTPFMIVLDEAGYYMVRGIDTMMAQARSLGFMIVISGQDMAAMQAVSPQIAESASANARLTIAGAMEDAQKTWHFLQKKFATHRQQVVSGRTTKSGLLGSKWVDRPDASFVVEDRVKIGDLQSLREGEFYFLMESNLVKARAFYTGQYWVPKLRANKFLLVRGPFDMTPGLDQSKDQSYFEGIEAIASSLLRFKEIEERLAKYRSPNDRLVQTVRLAEEWNALNHTDGVDVLEGYFKSLLVEHERNN